MGRRGGGYWGRGGGVAGAGGRDSGGARPRDRGGGGVGLLVDIVVEQKEEEVEGVEVEEMMVEIDAEEEEGVEDIEEKKEPHVLLELVL